MLDDVQYQLLNDRIQDCRRQIEACGLTVESRGDAAAFAAARRTFAGYVHPAFDPISGAQFGPGEFFWIAVRDAEEIAGVVAARKFTGSITDLLHRRRFWGFDHPSIDDIVPFPIAAPRHLGRVRGVLSFQGGLVLRRKLVRLRLATPIMHLIRLASFRHWMEDWQCAFYLRRTDPHGRRFREWGYPNHAPLFEGQASPGPKATHDREEIAFVSAREILATLSADNVVDFGRPSDGTEDGMATGLGHRYPVPNEAMVAPAGGMR